MRILKCVLVLITTLVFAFSSYAQSTKPKKLSGILWTINWISVFFLLNPKGFIPLIQPITEPALGNIGGVISPIFISPNKHPEKNTYTPPNITSVFGGYTAKNTWMVGAFRMASIPKHHLKYQLMAAYTSVNMDFLQNLTYSRRKTICF